MFRVKVRLGLGFRVRLGPWYIYRIYITQSASCAPSLPIPYLLQRFYMVLYISTC